MLETAGGGDGRKQDLIDAVVEKARWRLGAAFPDAMETFIRHYFGDADTDDILARSADTLFGAAHAHWSLAAEREPQTPSVRAYNPSLEDDGWHSEHTVVEVVTDDMPFLLASVVTTLTRRGLGVNWVLHPILAVQRDEAGRLAAVFDPRAADAALPRESFMHVEVTRQPDPITAEIAAEVEEILAEVRLAVADWRPMVARLEQTAEELRANATRADAEDLAEAGAFLEWMSSHNFTFLGYRAYVLRHAEDGVLMADIVTDAGLGLLRDRAEPIFADLRENEPLSPAARDFVLGPQLLTVSKSDRRSRVHRDVPMDTVIVKRFEPDGTVSGGQLFAGLFAAAAYNRSARNIPVLRRKVARILDRAGVIPRSHDGRTLMNIVENLPRDELFQASEAHLLATSLGILRLQFRPRVAVFLRRDDFNRFVSCLVYVPRDRYSTAIRQAVQRILAKAFGGSVTTHYGEVGDAPLARLQVFIKTTPGQVPAVDPAHLEAQIHAATRAWADNLYDALIAAHGEELGLNLWQRFGEAFPTSYGEAFSVDEAVADIALIERTVDQADMVLHLYRPFAGAEFQMRLKMFNLDVPVILSTVMPMLEDLGLTITEEMPYAVAMAGDVPRTVYIHDFALETRSRAEVDIGQLRDRFEDAFLKIWHGETECDGFNALVILEDLTWREAMILRAYAKYLRQAGIAFSQDYMEETLARYPSIARLIVRLFQAYFDPDADTERSLKTEAARAELTESLDAVENADHDRILRRFINLVESTLRTNYFQTDGHGRPRPYFSIKLNSAVVDDLPEPRPFVEIFVYSPQVEGIHLRAGRVARGGLRWSDRREDFRTEVLGLMKAQVVKNAVIVPVGAKGGFVVKRPPAGGGRDAYLATGVACYRTFIRGLLDITDNRAGDTIVPPPSVVRRDDDDPYLVVAADKGTATFSDFANEEASSYGFWLGDAFASGGGNGYDHKKMGITAKGAWESVKRHFREIGHDTQSQPFTVIGVGDMSGDVFGNGMLLSRQIKLLAAFNHLHIFIDPDPDPERSFVERQRLFETPQSTWADYSTDVLSPGGGVFNRRAKLLTLTSEIRALLGIIQERMTPTELIRRLLAAQVDLLWFGGIGTYVKASDETNADAGDRANDAVRINAKDLRCKVIGEGANLGITQLGRIEFAQSGGRLNTDFIDNSAGVDCSDHEVNIKILLDAAVRDGDLTLKQRNGLLAEMTDAVSDLVLRDNYLQTQAISMICAQGGAKLDGQVRLIRHLERQKRLNREVEDLPDDDELARRAAARQGLTRPEIAVLFSYTKIWVYDAVLDSELPDDRALSGDAIRYFPPRLHEAFADRIGDHRLRRELIATSVTNSLINRVGGAFVLDIMEKTGGTPVDVARAYLVAREVFGLRDAWSAIEALDLSVPTATQMRLNDQVLALLEHATLWFLRHDDAPLDISGTVEAFAGPVATLAGEIETLLPETARTCIHGVAESHESEGVPADTALAIARLERMPAACDIVRIAAVHGRPLGDCARAYFSLGEDLGFDWLRVQASRAPVSGHWQRLAVSALTDELFASQARLAETIVHRPAEEPQTAMAAWSKANATLLNRTNTLLAEFRDAEKMDFAMLTVASRYLRTLAEA